VTELVVASWVASCSGEDRSSAQAGSARVPGTWRPPHLERARRLARQPRQARDVGDHDQGQSAAGDGRGHRRHDRWSRTIAGWAHPDGTAVEQADVSRTPIAIAAPDSAVVLAYEQLADHLEQPKVSA
jgi:hypothetical protein